MIFRIIVLCTIMLLLFLALCSAIYGTIRDMVKSARVDCDDIQLLCLEIVLMLIIVATTGLSLVVLS